MNVLKTRFVFGLFEMGGSEIERQKIRQLADGGSGSDWLYCFWQLIGKLKTRVLVTSK